MTAKTNRKTATAKHLPTRASSNNHDNSGKASLIYPVVGGWRAYRRRGVVYGDLFFNLNLSGGQIFCTSVNFIKEIKQGPASHLRSRCKQMKELTERAEIYSGETDRALKV